MSHNPQNTTRLTRQHRDQLIAAGGARAHSDTSFVVDGSGGGVVLFGVTRDKALELVKAVPDTTLTARSAATGQTFAGRGAVGLPNGKSGRRTALGNMTPAERRAHRAKSRAAVRKLQDAHELRMLEERADRRANKNKKKTGGEPKKAKKAA